MKALRFVFLLATSTLLFLALAVSADNFKNPNECHSTTERPCTTTEQCTTKPCTTTEQPCTTTEQCTTQPCTTTQQPCTTTEQPCTTTERPCTTTEQCTTKPCTTTEQPCTTTEQPCTTTEQPCTTTEQPCTTTEQPCTTTEQPCTTTVQPCTTTEECTTKHFTTSTEKPCTTTEKPDECPKEVCNWCKLEKCRESNIKKFEHCLESKRWHFVDCNDEAEHKFKRCLRGDPAKKRDAGKEGDECDYEAEEKNNVRWAECKKEYDEDKEQCLVERKAAHADCWESRNCRESKCLRWIKDCKPPVTPAVTTTTTGQPPVLSSGCPAIDYFGAAADFNVYITGSPSILYDLDLPVGDIEGRAAINGGFRVTSFGTAQNYPCANTAADAKKFDLIVNGKMDYNNGQLFCGSSVCLAAGNSPSLRQLPYGATNTLALNSQDLTSRSGLDFVSTTGYLQGVSNYFCMYSAGVHDLLRVSVYASVNVSQIVIPSGGSYVEVINIKGSGPINFSNFQIPSGVDPSQVIFNVCGDNSINISSFELNGNLLALNSDVVLQNGHITGNVYVRSLVGSGSGQVNLAPCPK